MNAYREELRAAALPAGILLLACVAALATHHYALTLGGFDLFGPYTVLVVGTAIALWFNRGRAFVALVSLLIAFIAYRLTHGGGDDDFPLRAVLAGASIFVPANMLLVVLIPEKGIAHFRNYRWMLLGLVEILLTAWIASAGHNPMSGTSWHAALDHWLLRPAPVPLLGRLMLAAAFVMALKEAWSHWKPLDIGMAGALAAFFLACEWPDSAAIYGLFVFAAGAMLLIAVLQESHRMAFRDELTGLPGRRALEESLLALGPSYTIAMVDVDHFKKFNDTHGHDTGDQVLKLVGAKLAEVDGGGKAFRYGGEEFAVVFPDRGIEEALPSLEKLRRGIEEYRMSARATEQRRSESRSNSERRTQSKSAFAKQNPGSPLRTNRAESLSVTVSIGAAERTELLDTPKVVIKAADEALYRAKDGGRNRVST